MRGERGGKGRSRVQERRGQEWETSCRLPVAAAYAASAASGTSVPLFLRINIYISICRLVHALGCSPPAQNNGTCCGCGAGGSGLLRASLPHHPSCERGCDGNGDGEAPGSNGAGGCPDPNRLHPRRLGAPRHEPSGSWPGSSWSSQQPPQSPDVVPVAHGMGPRFLP